ncbi:MAG: DUF4038 domain-containing protein, partial [Armatimonadota bacterium]
MKRREFVRQVLKGACVVSLSSSHLTASQRRGTKVSSKLPRLKVFDDPKHPNNRRFLVTEKGQPFFYLADTAWELFHRLNREEAETYLKDRAQKGFTVIQAVVLAELDGLNTPNAYGQKPLHNNDPTQPNEAYF